MEEIGIPALQDMNSGNLLGGQYSAFTVNPDDNTRSSSESAFLQAAFASTRTNLKIYPQTLAKQILFDANRTATGVRVNSAGAEYILSAKKEVILSGGAVCGVTSPSLASPLLASPSLASPCLHLIAYIKFTYIQ